MVLCGKGNFPIRCRVAKDAPNRIWLGRLFFVAVEVDSVAGAGANKGDGA